MSEGVTPGSFSFEAPAGPSPNPAAPQGYGMSGTYKLVRPVPGSQEAVYRFTASGPYVLSKHQAAFAAGGSALNGGGYKGETF